jgi:hypothetical protein
MHLNGMKKLLYLILILFSGKSYLFAQQKIDGTYNAKYRTFTPKDQHILVKTFSDDHLALFMLMGDDPFIPYNNEVGFIDTTGRVVIKPLYNNCSAFRDGYALVLIAGKTYQDNRYGLIDKKGKEVVPIKYLGLKKCENGLFVAITDGKMGFVNNHNRVIVPFGKYMSYATPPPPRFMGEYDDVGHTNFRWDELYVRKILFRKYIGVRTAQKWAVIDSTGKEIIPPKFDEIGLFVNNLVVAKIDGKFGVSDTTGQMIIPAIYDGINLTGKNYAFVYKGGKTGVLDLENKLIIPIEFSGVSPFGDGFTAYNNNDKAILFDAGGKKVAEAHNPSVEFPVWGQKDDGVVVYNSRDKKYHSYQDVSDFNSRPYNYNSVSGDNSENRQMYYKRDGKWGLMDSIGRESTAPMFDGFDRRKLDWIGIQNKYIAVVNDSKWGVISMNGKILIKPVYDQLIADQGKLFAKKDGKCGFFNQYLVQVTPLKYDSLVITHPSGQSTPKANSAIIRARIGTKWGLINNEGNEIIPFKYDELLWVYYNLALVKNDGKYGIANLHGQLTAGCVYDEIRFNDFNGGVNYDRQLVTRKDGLFGLINSYGMMVAPPVYESIIPLFLNFRGKYQVTLRGKLGMIDGAYGHLVIPCEYDDLRFYNDEGANTYARNWHASSSSYIMAFKNGYCGLLDSLGKVRLPIVYSKIFFKDEHYFVSMEDREGMVDKNMKWIIPPKYDWISSEHDNIYVVHANNSLGLIKPDGDVIAETVYRGFDFCGDKIIVFRGDKYGTIDMDGKVIDPIIYSKIECLSGKLTKLINGKTE